MNIDAMNAEIERHSKLDFDWGTSDCFVSASDIAAAAWGSNPLAEYRRYSTERGAGRVLVNEGCESVADLLERHLKEIPVFSAHRGDMGIIVRDGETAAGVFTATGFAVKSKQGMISEPVTAVSRAFTLE